MRAALLLLLFGCASLSAQADKEFQQGELVNVKFIRPFYTEKDLPLDPGGDG